jgi:hypothetical protein
LIFFWGSFNGFWFFSFQELLRKNQLLLKA